MIISNRSTTFKPAWLDILRQDPVHPADETKTVARRVQNDRIVYTMLNNDQPEVFLQVALCKQAPTSADQLWDEEVNVGPFSFAVFYSIFRLPDAVGSKGATQKLLFGAVKDIKRQYPEIDRFITLSPIPSLTKSQIQPEQDAIWQFISDKKDPVARFHISNGAMPWHLWPNADRSQLRQAESMGWMVSYDYTTVPLPDSEFL